MTAILIVEDDPAIRALILVNLSIRSYQVEATDTAETALKLTRSQPPDLILADIMLPGMNGFDFVKLLAEDALTNQIPVIFISAYLLEFREDPPPQVIAAITKPFSIAKLITTIGKYFDGDRDFPIH